MSTPSRHDEVSTEEAAPSRRAWFGLAVLSAGLGMIVLDGTIVGVALPDIIRDLNMNITDAQWVNSLYAVLLAALLLSTGRLSDRWGRKRLFLVGIVIFIGGSILAAMSDASGPLIAARAVQAVGAALIMPSTLSTVNATFRGKYRATAFGVWGAVISGAAAIGPLAGGALTQWGSWEWIFLVNIPLGAIVFVAAIFTVKETRGGKALPGADVDGALLSAIGFGALVFAVIEGPEIGWWVPKADLHIFGLTWPTTAPISLVPIAFAVAAVALTLFVFWERHRARVRRSALLDLDLFRLPTFSWGNTTAAMVAVGEFAILFVLPLYLIYFVANSIARISTWGDAMGLVVLEGIVILVLVLTGFRKAVFHAVPQQLKVAISVGIGLFIALIGFVDAGFVRRTAEGPVPVQLGTDGFVNGWPTFVFVLGLVLLVVLWVRKVKGAILIAIIAICSGTGGPRF